MIMLLLLGNLIEAEPKADPKKLTRFERLKLAARKKFSRAGTTGELEAQNGLAEDDLLREKTRQAAGEKLKKNQEEIRKYKETATAEKEKREQEEARRIIEGHQKEIDRLRTVGGNQKSKKHKVHPRNRKSLMYKVPHPKRWTKRP